MSRWETPRGWFSGRLWLMRGRGDSRLVPSPLTPCAGCVLCVVRCVLCVVVLLCCVLCVAGCQWHDPPPAFLPLAASVIHPSTLRSATHPPMRHAHAAARGAGVQPVVALVDNGNNVMLPDNANTITATLSSNPSG